MDLPFLEMKAGFWEAIEVARMVIMEVGENDVVDLGGTDIQQAERLHRTTQERTFSARSDVCIEAGIDDDDTPIALHHPHVIIHRHRPLVEVTADEVVSALRVPRGIADRKYFVFGAAHQAFLLGSAPRSGTKT